MAKAKRTVAAILGRITYTTVYIFLCVVLGVLLLLVPADIVRYVLKYNVQQSNILVLAIVYVLTLIIVFFIYALRLYTTRTLLASIPKPYSLYEKRSLKKEVRAMIAVSLGRNAAIAWEARPKPANPEVHRGLDTIVEDTDPAYEDQPDDAQAPQLHEKGEGRIRKFWGRLRSRKQKDTTPTTPVPTVGDETGITLQATRPVWGHIEHDGWDSPESRDLPDLQYSTVLAELPNLIEAKAVSLAPRDPQPSAPGSPLLDPEAVVLLQRAPNMTMRDYIGHLTGLGMLPSGAHDAGGQTAPSVSAFADAYEQARFSTRPMSKAHFRNLMHLFAELLRAMRPPEQALLYGDEDGSEDGYDGAGYGDGFSLTESDGHIDDDAPRDGTPTTPTRSNSSASRLSSRSAQNRNGFRAPLDTAHHLRRRASARNIERERPSPTSGGQRYRTAPTTPMTRFHDAQSRSRRGDMSSDSSESPDTFARTRRPYMYASSSASQSSSVNLSLTRSLSQRSRRSGPPPSTSSSARSLSLTRTQSNQGSVIIRLATPEDGDAAGGLPYVLTIGDT